MTIKNRIEKLEIQSGVDNTANVHLWQIFWADGSALGFMGKARTPTGWQTVSAGNETTEAEFYHRLLAMAQDGKLGAATEG